MDLPPIEIKWEAPAACPDLQSVRAATERLLGRRLAGLQGIDVRAAGHVERTDVGSWELHVVLAVGRHVEDERLVAKKCSALGEAMALKVALAIDPLAVVDAVGQAPKPDAAPPIEAPAAASRGRTARQPSFLLGLRVLGGIGLGPLPGATPGTAVYGSLQFPRFRVELGGAAFWGGVARYEALPDVGADLQLFTGALRGCVAPGDGSWRFPICGGVELGVMRGEGFGAAATVAKNALWAGVVIGPAVQFRMTGRLSLWVEADAVLTVLKPEFYVRNLERLYSPTAGGSRVSLGLEANF